MTATGFTDQVAAALGASPGAVACDLAEVLFGTPEPTGSQIHDVYLALSGLEQSGRATSDRQPVPWTWRLT